MKKLIIALGGALVTLAFAAGPASAYFVEIDTFTVTKNGTDILVDNFADSNPPPSGPASPTTYGTNGTFAETGVDPGAVATMTTATGAPNVFGGTNFIRHNANFRTNTDPLPNENGLKSNDTLKVTGLFNVNIPANNRESYGVYFIDAAGGTAGNDQLEVRLVRGQDGVLRINFQRVDHLTQTSASIAGIQLTSMAWATRLADVTNDQLLLQLDKLSAGSNLITASFTYFDVDNLTSFSMTFGPTDSIFNGEDWTRAGFFARVAVPEPGTLAILGLGLAGLGFLRRRRAA